MASRPPSLLIPALPGPSLGTAYQAPSTPLKVKSNLCLLAPFFFCALHFSFALMSLHSFLCIFGFFSFFLFFFFYIFSLCFLDTHLFLCASDLLLLSFSPPPPHYLHASLLPYCLAKAKQILLILYMEQGRGMCINICVLTFPCYCGLVNFSGTLPPPQRKIVAADTLQSLSCTCFPHEFPLMKFKVLISTCYPLCVWGWKCKIDVWHKQTRHSRNTQQRAHTTGAIDRWATSNSWGCLSGFWLQWEQYLIGTGRVVDCCPRWHWRSRGKKSLFLCLPVSCLHCFFLLISETSVSAVQLNGVTRVLEQQQYLSVIVLRM